MAELFVELLCEEIPARMAQKAAQDFERLVIGHLTSAGLTFGDTFATSTPRRLVLSVMDLPTMSADRHEERKGPRVGAPDKAIEGFLRASGLSSVEEAEIVSDPKKGDSYLARRTVPGRPTLEICAEAIGEAIQKFPWPVSMRWGAASIDPGSLRWVRPLSSILATFGDADVEPAVVPVEVAGVSVGNTTVGHRVHASEAITVRRLADYLPAMDAAKVQVNFDERRETILVDARQRVAALGLKLVEDTRLADEVTGLVEWPVVLVGQFEEAALALPDEVIRLTIRENQKCFVTRDPATDRLSNSFVLTANLEAADGGEAIIAGNERVVRARLADARFFWEQDRKKPLDEHAKGLASVTFHEKLGTQAERVERIAALARELAPVVGADADLAEQAARLCKADLTTLMVGEFPELQGYVGRHYAEAEGLPDAVAVAAEAHYSPLGPADEVPRDPVAVTVALADKADSLVTLWAAGEKPTGSGDAYGLRRAALGIVRLILSGNLRLALSTGEGGGLIADALKASPVPGSEQELVDFMLDRFSVQQRELGVPVEIVRAVQRSLTVVDLVDVGARIEALRTFLETDDGANLMAGFKRASNILRAEAKKSPLPEGAPDASLLAEPEEIALGAALAGADAGVSAAVAEERYTDAMAQLAALRAPVDAFFDKVLVNADDPAVRDNRLKLLLSLQDTTRLVADFGQLAG
ncbi:MAG: glycine--tRNA ligase subunit beta [Pseudomonadota bacterium]